MFSVNFRKIIYLIFIQGQFFKQLRKEPLGKETEKNNNKKHKKAVPHQSRGTAANHKCDLFLWVGQRCTLL